MVRDQKPLVWLKGKIVTPPFSETARIQAGYMLRKLQNGEMLQMPHSRSMPSIGKRCHELRINDQGVAWRIIYRIDPDAVIILDTFEKKTNKTPRRVIAACKERILFYDSEKDDGPRQTEKA
jgi:phage-related protein